jgi:hypothetical protein
MVLLITLPNEYTDRGRILSLADFLIFMYLICPIGT